MNLRNFRNSFRHARRRLSPPPGRGRLPLLSAAAIGAASVVAVSVSQLGAHAPADSPQQETVVGQSASQGRVAQDEAVRDGAVRSNRSRPRTPTPTPTASSAPRKPAPTKVELYYQFQLQPNGYYCGPAATRIAISAQGVYPTQDNLAKQLGTTINGTNSSVDIARVLNKLNRRSAYQTTMIPSKKTTKSQTEKLRADVVRAVSGGRPMVVNIAGTGTDVNGNAYSFPGGHYIVVVGYKDNGRQVKIADSAYPVGNGTYWMTTQNLTNWAGTRGYAS